MKIKLHPTWPNLESEFLVFYKDQLEIRFTEYRKGGYATSEGNIGQVEVKFPSLSTMVTTNETGHRHPITLISYAAKSED